MGCWVNRFILVPLFLLIVFTLGVSAACASGHSCSILTVANTACFSNNPFDCRYMGGITYCYVQNDTCTSNETCVDPFGTTAAHCECKVTNTQYSSACYSNDVYYYDNCGGLQSKKTECNDGTTYSSNYCSGTTKVVRDKTVKGCSGSSCTSSTTTETVDTCESYEKCSSGSCVKKSCTEQGHLESCVAYGNTKCSGSSAYECKTSASGDWCYIKTATCGSGEYCYDPSSASVGAQCFTLGCYGSNLYYYFKSDGSRSDMKQDCLSAGKYCSGTSCVNQVCTPGAKRCNGTSTVETCKSDGSGWTTSSSCSSNQVCDSGSCRTKTCSEYNSSYGDCTLYDFTTNPTWCSNGNPWECIYVSSIDDHCSTKTDTCTSSEICKDPLGTTGAHCECNPTNLQYTSKCNVAGEGGDVYWYDNCGGIRDQKEDCGSNGYDGSPYCVGRKIVRNYLGKGCSSSTNACYLTSTPIDQSTCADYEYCSSGSCSNGNIASSVWSVSSAWEGDTVTLTANTLNIADGVKIKFYIFEDDVFINDDLNTLYAFVSSNKAVLSYKVPNLNDGYGAPEIKFTASVDAKSSISLTSAKLPITQLCSGKTGNKRCNSLGEGVEEEYYNANCSTYWSALATCASYQKCSNGECISKSCTEQGYLDSCVLLSNTLCSENSPFECKVSPAGNWCYIQTGTCGTNEYCYDPTNPLVGAQCFTLGCSNSDVYYFFKSNGAISDKKEDCPSYSGCLGGICADGSITSATWSRTLVMVGDPVKMVANFSGVEDGTKVTFKVLEYDIWRDQSTGIEVQGTVIGGLAEADLNIPKLKDFLSNAEIHFVVSITDKPSIKKTSELLTIYYDPKIAIDLYDEQIENGYLGQVVWSVSSGNEIETGIEFGNSTSRLCSSSESEYSGCYKRMKGSLVEENIYFGLIFPKEKGRMYLRTYAVMDNASTIYSDWKSLDIYDDNSSKIVLWFKKIDLDDVKDGGADILNALTLGNCIDNGLWTWGCGLDVALFIPIGKVVKMGTTAVKFSKGADVIKSLDAVEDIAKYSVDVKIKGVRYSKLGAELFDAHSLNIINIDKATGKISSGFENLAEYVMKNSITVSKNLLAKGLIKEELEKFVVKGIDLQKLDLVLSDSKWVANNQEAVTTIRGLAEAKGSFALKETVDNWENIAQVGRKTSTGKFPELYLKNIAGKEITLESKGILNPLSSNQKLLAVLDECGEQLEAAWGEKIAVVSLKETPVLSSVEIRNIVVNWLNDPVTWGPSVNKVVIEMPNGATHLIERTIFSKNEIIGATALISGIYVFGPDQVSAMEINEVAPQICTSFEYSDWNTVCVDGMQYRRITLASPFGCIDGSPVLSRSCIQCSIGDSCCDLSGMFKPSNTVCATNYQTELRCSGNNVEQRTSSRFCSGNSGACDGNITWFNWTQKQTCLTNQLCSNNSCVTIACSSNSDCGTNSWLNSNYCNANNVWGTYRTYTCNNAGTSSASCTFNDANQSRVTCLAGQICSNATCITPACSTDLDCGTNAFIGTPYCSSNSVMQAFRTFTCKYPMTASAYCLYSDANQTKSTCTSDQYCSSGACVNKQCTSGECCDQNGFFKSSAVICSANILGAKYCDSNKVMQGLTNQYCSGSSGSCNGSILPANPLLVETCAITHTCIGSSCVFTCKPNWVCSDWGSCGVGSIQTRTCTDTSNCGVDLNKPITTQACVRCNLGDPCCDERSMLRSSGYVCQSNILGAKSCSQNKVIQQIGQKVCMGTNSLCNSETNWTGFIDVNVCSSDSVCVNDSCVKKQCNTGPCCDQNGFFKPSNVMCNLNADNQTTCFNSTSTTTRTAVLYCSGSSSSCDGNKVWLGWKVPQNCGSNQLCSNGFCLDKQCSSGACCDTNRGLFYSRGLNCASAPSEYRCNGNSVEIRNVNYTCNGESSVCSNSNLSYSDWAVDKTCKSTEFCSDGSCVAGTVECLSASDCGTDGWLNNNYCANDTSVWDTSRVYTCSDSGTVNSVCSFSDYNLLKVSCGSGKVCLGGQCVNSCTPNWICSDWNSCSNSTQSRTCSDGCGATKSETQNCSVPKVVTFRTTSLTYPSTSAVALANYIGAPLTQYGATIYSCSEFNCKTTQGQFTVPNSVNTTNKMWVRNETELCICSSPASTYPRKYSSLDSDRTKVSTLITSIDSNKEVLKALINSCVPQWTCSNWTGCTGGKTTRVCTVTNNCLDNVIITPVTQTKCTACYDSDKNNYLYKGTTRGIFTPTSSTTLTQTSKTDVCLNSKTLREYYCSDTLYASYVDVNCPKSCSYGKCH